MLGKWGPAIVALSAMTAFADDAPSPLTGFVDCTFTDPTGDHHYVVFVPNGDAPADGWPVILFLHGAGERGTDGRRQLDYGLGPIVKLREETFPAIVVFPQAEDMTGPILRTWSPRSNDGRRAMAILNKVESEYPTDPQRRILTGWSMGGYGTWRLAAADPAKWSTVLPIAGGADPALASPLAKANIWAFHGALDAIVPASESRTIVDAVRETGADITYSEIADEGHDVWRRVYDSDEVLDWMLAPRDKRSPNESITLPDERTEQHAETVTPPFVPAMVVENALTLRFGAEAMQTISYGLPDFVNEQDVLKGELDDVTDQLEMDDRTFAVTFGDLTFTAELADVTLRPRGADRLQTEFAVRHLTLQVEHIEVTDGEVGFEAGPAQIVVGHRAPVKLQVEVRPAVVDRKLSLKLLRSSFSIPDANWYVSSPEKITLQGEWLTEYEVETAVVGGVYVRKETIEQQVLSAVPTLLEQLSEQVSYDPLAKMVQALWPLPVYQPRLQVHPESISTDATGVSLTLGVTAASVDDTAPSPVPVVRASAPVAYNVEKTPDLQVGVAVDVIDHLTAIIAGTPSAQVYVSDLPDRPFRELTKLSTLSRAIPGLNRYPPDSEVWGAIRLENPVRLRPNVDSSDDASHSSVLIEAPRISLTLSVVPNQPSPAPKHPASMPQQLLVADLEFRQPLMLAMTESPGGDQRLSLAWGSEPHVRATVDRSAEGTLSDSMIDEGELARLFEQGWQHMHSAQTSQVVELPTISIGESKLEIQNLDWAELCLAAAFRPARTTIRNATQQSLTYHVRGPSSRWSEPRTLNPGEARTYATGSQLTLRPDRDWEFSSVQLPTGTSWEWRSTVNSRQPAWVQIHRAFTPHDSEAVTEARGSQRSSP